ncbi:Ig-like domain-containing protein [Pontibacter roseus]|uniref:Ig-like domain-containing protein n=1 Tax=Pontibacter roseus TaxID=336989 RepID=UPI00037386CA|nr:Ig-like domain-containing protein [Pontibacter roseus]
MKLGKHVFLLILLLLVGTSCEDDKDLVANPDKVALIEITAPSLVLNVGDSVQLNAVAKNASGDVVQGKTVEWATSDAAVATVNDGKVRGVGPGSASISARSEGVGSEIGFTVQAVAQNTISIPVSLGSDVPTPARRLIEGFHSVLDSASPSEDARLSVYRNREENVIFALGPNDAIMLMAMVKAGEEAVLDANSTADAMVRFALNPAESDSLTPEQLSQGIRGAASFAALQAEVEKNLTSGGSPLEASATTALAASVATESKSILLELRTAGGNAGATTASTDLPYYFIETIFKGENLWLEDATGAGVDLLNDTRLYWEASSWDEKGEQIAVASLEWLPFNFFEFFPYINPPVRETLQVKDGKFVVRIHQDETTRRKHAVYLIQQMILSVLEWAGAQKGAREIGATEKVSQIILNEQMPNLLGKADGASALSYFGAQLEQMKYEWFYTLLRTHIKNLPVTTPSGKFLRSLINVWERMEVAVSVGQRAEFTYQLVNYWDYTSSVELCKNKGQISECVRSVELTPLSVVFKKGETRQLNAKVTGVKGTDLSSTHDVEWASSDESVAKVSQTGLVTGVGAGSAEISAAIQVQGIQSGKSATVKVEEARLDVTPKTSTVESLNTVCCETSSKPSIQFKVAGGTPPYTWGIDGRFEPEYEDGFEWVYAMSGQINTKTGLYNPNHHIVEATIMVRDAAGKTGEAKVNVTTATAFEYAALWGSPEGAKPGHSYITYSLSRGTIRRGVENGSSFSHNMKLIIPIGESILTIKNSCPADTYITYNISIPTWTSVLDWATKQNIYISNISGAVTDKPYLSVTNFKGGETLKVRLIRTQ